MDTSASGTTAISRVQLLVTPSLPRNPVAYGTEELPISPDHSTPRLPFLPSAMRCAACAVACAGLALIAPALALLDVPLSEEDLKNVENAESDGWVLGRVNGVSTDGLVTKRLRALDGAGAVLGRLTAYMEDVVDGPGADFNCGVRRNNKWVKNLGGFSAARSFPLASDGCVSMATERAGDLKTSPDDALEMTAAYTELQFKVAAAVVKDVGEDAVRLFKKPSVGVQWHHSSGK